jgi:tRNA (guanine37-N1)-methyltransferase
MRIDVITLFPQMFEALNFSMTGKAQKNGILSLFCHNLREFASDRHGTVDDYPFGGEAGMVLKPEPLKAAILSITLKNPVHTIFLSPQGIPFTQKKAGELAKKRNILIICGHYKGIDERIRQKFINEEISIGDYVLTGGELPAMVLIDSIIRLQTGVLGDKDSLETDSFYSTERLGWPVYTRPEEFDGMHVPQVLLSGNHKQIEKWRIAASLKNTKTRRPDLFDKLKLTQAEKDLINSEIIL